MCLPQPIPCEKGIICNNPLCGGRFLGQNWSGQILIQWKKLQLGGLGEIKGKPVVRLLLQLPVQTMLLFSAPLEDPLATKNITNNLLVEEGSFHFWNLF